MSRCYLLLASWGENFLAIFYSRVLEGTTLLSCVSVGDSFSIWVKGPIHVRIQAFYPSALTLDSMCGSHVLLGPKWCSSVFANHTQNALLTPGTQRPSSPISKVICVFHLGVLVHLASPNITRRRNSPGAEVFLLLESCEIKPHPCFIGSVIKCLQDWGLGTQCTGDADHRCLCFLKSYFRRSGNSGPNRSISCCFSTLHECELVK